MVAAATHYKKILKVNIQNLFLKIQKYLLNYYNKILMFGIFSSVP